MKLPVILVILALISYCLFIQNAVKNYDTQAEDSNKLFTENINPHIRDDTILEPFEILSEPIAGSNINTGYSYSPKIAVENDKLYVIWCDDTNISNCGNNGEVFFRYFNGDYWSDIQVISEPVPGQDNYKGYSGYPDITVENGKIYVVWNGDANLSGEGTDGDVFFRCNLTGSGWEPIQVISEPVIGYDYNIELSYQSCIAVDNGNIFVAWADNNNTNNASSTNPGCEEIFFRSNLTGTGWEDIQVISEPEFGKDLNDGISWFPDIAAEDGNVYVTWGDNYLYGGSYDDWDIFYRSNLSGSGWDDIEVVSEPIPGIDINKDVSWSPRIAIENDNVYLIWEDFNNSNGSGIDQDLQFRCKLSGKSWGPIRVISEPVEGKDFNTGDCWWKDIAVENGSVFVVWEDDNETFSSGKDLDIHFRCFKSGYDWGVIQVISEPIIGVNTNTKDSDLPAIAVSFGKVHVVWEDSNDTNGAGSDYDIFYRQVPPLTLWEANVTTRSGNSSTYFNFSISYVHNLNIEPVDVYLNLSGTNYPMFEKNPKDKNYLNGKKYYFNITHLDIGQYTYTFWASDGNNNSKFPISNKITVYNTPPKIITVDDTTAVEDIYYEVKYEHGDIDAKNIDQPIIWNFSSNAGWLTFNSTTAILNGTPSNDDIGEFWVKITVNDTIANDTTNFMITVIGINDDPVIITEDVEIAYEDVLYKVNYNAIDVDSNINRQLWMLETNTTSWLKLNEDSGILSGTPLNADVGTYWVNVTVDDDDGGIAFSNFSLEVLNVNDQPKIKTEDVAFALVDTLYYVDYDATDIDNPQSRLIWSLDTNASSWLAMDTKTGVLSGTPAVEDLGWYNVNVSVNDSAGGLDWHVFVLSVEKPNAPPVITTIDNTTAIVNLSYQTDYEAKDDRTPAYQLKWTLNTNASWLQFHETTAILYGKPMEKDIGTYWVNISVIDRDFTVSFHNFTLRVIRSPKPVIHVNNPPELSEPRMFPESGDTDTEFEFSVHYYDSDNEPPVSIKVVIDGINYNLTLKGGDDSTNGTYKIGLKLQKGRHTCYFTASDGHDIVTLDEFITSNIQDVSKTTDKPSFWENFIWLFLILIILLLIIIAVIVRKRKKSMEKYAEERVTYGPTPALTKTVAQPPAPPTTLTPIPTTVSSITPKPTTFEPPTSTTSTTPQPVVSIPTEIRLVGREKELHRLLGFLDQAEANRGGTVFITGEAGIGKTRLLNELKQIAHSKNFQVLSGNCTFESLTPYSAYLEALRSGGLDYLFAEETPRVEAIYLITYDGLLINETVRQETRLDPDVFSSMLFTVSNFINESLSMLLGSDKEGTLNSLGYENYRILIESGKYANLVVIISGKETEFLINDMRELFKKINESYGTILVSWDGDEKKVEGIEKVLVTLINSGKYDGIYYEKDDPKTRRDLLLKNISMGLSRSTKTAPLLLCIEDLQWADPSSLALMHYIARNTKSSSVLTIGTFRPEEITAVEGSSHPLAETLQLMDREDLYKELSLQRLPKESISEFLSSQLGKNEFNDEFKDRIYRETDGNPLFIIQLIKYLVEEEVVVKDEEDNTWKLDRELEEINIPTKIYNVIARRLDKLEKGDRKVLDFASIIGPTFTSKVLSHSLGIERLPLLEQLRGLEKTHKLIYSFDGNFKFDHDKVKEVLYNEIPPELRMEYHSIIGNTIENLNQDNLDTVVGELAFHYYRSKDKGKALQYLTRAAAEAKKRYSNDESIRFYNQALEFEDDSEKRANILEYLGDIYYLIRNYDLSIDSYNSALVLTEGIKKAELMAKLGGIFERKGEYESSIEICNGALELVKGSWTAEEALALQNIGNVYLSKKEYDKALGQYEKSLEIREKIGDELGIGACLNNIALVHYGKGDYESALKYLEKSLEISKKLGDHESSASTLNNIGAIYQNKGDFAKAKIYYDMSQSIRAKIAAYAEVPGVQVKPGITQIIRGGYRTTIN